MSKLGTNPIDYTTPPWSSFLDWDDSKAWSLVKPDSSFFPLSPPISLILSSVKEKENQVKEKTPPLDGSLPPLEEIAALFLDKEGRQRTESLFIETSRTLDKYPAFFTLGERDREKDGIIYISMKRKYLAIGDPTEYQVAQQLLGSWKHWEKLLKCEWFKPYVEEWRAELRIAEQSAQIKRLKRIAESDSPSALSATKALLEEPWLRKTKRGRPSKEEIERNLKEELSQKETLIEDAQRIGIM